MGQQKENIISGEPEKTAKDTKKKKSNKIKLEEEKVEKPKKRKKIRSKSYLSLREKIQNTEHETIEEAIELLKNSVKNNKNNSIELHIALNMKPKIDNKLKIKSDKNLVIHIKIGNLTDKSDNIVNKINSNISEILKTKSSGKKKFIKSVSICTTQSPSIKIKVEE